MLQAKSKFGFAPNLLEKFQKIDCTPDNSPNAAPWLNRRNFTDKQTLSDTPATEITINQSVPNQSVPNYGEDYLRQVGEQFREVRTSLGISLRQLHYQTLVPIAHIEALETGCVEKLPTAVYVRGFVRKIGNALGLDGDRLAESLPQQDYSKTVLPSRQGLSASKSDIIVLTRLHLSIGYFTLLLMSTFWLVRQENSIPPELKPSEIYEIQPYLTTEKNISTHLQENAPVYC